MKRWFLILGLFVAQPTFFPAIAIADWRWWGPLNSQRRKYLPFVLIIPAVVLYSLMLRLFGYRSAEHSQLLFFALGALFIWLLTPIALFIRFGPFTATVRSDGTPADP